MDRFTFTGNKTSQISFPLGGIGTGSIGLAGNGRLIDWEIANRPNKQSLNGFSHFAIKAEKGGKVIDARVLHGDLPPPFTGAATTQTYRGFGFGPDRGHLSGMPHFPETTFRGEFPLAGIEFTRTEFPASVSMSAFNPFIPLNDRDSGIPAAFFEIAVTNTTGERLSYTVAGTLSNPLPANNLHTVKKNGNVHLLHLASDSVSAQSVEFGDLSLGTDAERVSVQRYWYRGAWFDSLEVYWRDFIQPGGFADRNYGPGGANGDSGILAAHFDLEPGSSKAVRFVVSWNYPNAANYWSKSARAQAEAEKVSLTWRNYYATLWQNSAESALYGLANWGRLYGETLRFKEALFSSDLPPAALEAVSATVSVLKTPTVMRLQDGTFYGFEGCHPASGCCEGSCTHVWNYAQALPFLFPKLERSMRDVDYRYNQQENGAMPFRLQLPLGLRHPGGRSCADGLFGGVMKIYRDWKICGDTEWLREIWPAVKQSIAYAWEPTNEDRWDPERTGVLKGRQHHTLDVELFGPNAWLTGFYLGALKAAAIMAQALDEPDQSVEYRSLFEKGKKWADEHLFNGEYYHQLVDLRDRSIPAGFGADDYYWSEEHGEIKYQIGEGCEIDQVLAQWHANLYGLGEIYDPDQVKTALRSIYKYGFKKPMRDHYNPCRVYCLNDEAGLVIAAWPEGKEKPMIPLPYSQETQNGYEYAAAIQMIQAGLIEEGMSAVEAIRDRYDGERRNPWNEFECGNNYARSMASYSLLNAFSRFEFDMTEGMMGFDPLERTNGKFRCFWSLDPAWGVFGCTTEDLQITVYDGSLGLKRFRFPDISRQKVRGVAVSSSPVQFEAGDGEIRFPEAVRIGRDQVLRIELT